MTRPALPPNPTGISQQTWARQVYEYLLSQTSIKGRTDPTPVQLTHVMAADMPRATRDGLLMFNPTTGKILVSVGGAWKSVTLDP